MTVSVFSLGDYQDVQKELVVTKGTNKCVLKVKPGCGMLIIVKDGDVLIPVDLAWCPVAKEIGGEGRSNMWGGSSKGQRVGVTNPGLYRVTIPQIDGYQAIPSRDVVVKEGEHVEIIVQLQRSP